MLSFEVIYEDNHLLVVNKPAGLATMGAGDDPSVHRMACRYIGEKYNKPGKVFLGVVHRLDSMASGVLILARTSKAASRLSEQFSRAGDGPRKIYLAAVEGELAVDRGMWRDWLMKDESAHRMRVVASGRGEAIEACLEFQTLRRPSTPTDSATTFVAVRLMTGRKHQIRVQFSDRGHAVVGDVKYGATQRSMRGIALHAWSLTIQHPTLGTPMTFRSAPPTSWGKSLLNSQDLEQLDRADAW